MIKEGLFLILVSSLMWVACSTSEQKRTPAADNSVINAWVEMGPDGVAIARAVTSGTTCPSLDSDGNTSPMNVRVGPSSNGNFPNLVCEAAVNPKTKYQIGGQTLPVASNHHQKIIVIGDTGCRIKKSDNAAQPCNDVAQYPFASVAAAASSPISRGFFRRSATRFSRR